MENINELVNNEWASKYMNDKKKSAKEFKEFNKEKFQNMLKKYNKKNNNSEEISDNPLNKIYKLSDFSEKLNKKELNENDLKKIDSIKELITHINKKYNNAFNNYVEKKKDISMIKLKDLGSKHIIKIHNHFYKNHSLIKLNFLITDMNSNIAYFKQKHKDKKNKDYSRDLDRIHTQYMNINFLIKDLKKNSEIEENELNQLRTKEEFMSENVNEILDLIKKEKRIKNRKKKLSIFGKVISALAIIGTIWQVTELSYKYRDEIKTYYQNKIKPYTYELKQETIDKFFLNQE